ncbi:MAG TPA: hypothetical protein VFZ59_00005, partial [Verrucomicrobiae bacterium]|nr:hypothetical protein [Verrucomicrobiae bacterium]
MLFRHVIAWVNVCGPLNGTRMADWILESRLRTWLFQCQCYLQKRDFTLVRDLSRAAGLLAKPLQLPARLRMLSLVGFPLRKHMTTRHSRFCHQRLSLWGPNDGTVSLADVVQWPGEIFPVWGVDHYFRPEALARELIAAMLRHLADNRQGIHFSPLANRV